jgi:nucleotide-binding universal stress UspA family protein
VAKVQQQILVYTDFTEVGEKSIKWAIFLAKKFSKNLLLIHVINENTYNYFEKNEIDRQVKETLNELCISIKNEHNLDCDYYAEEGCTCTIINSTAERIDAFIVVLGTHGKNDLQFLSGSAAGKIIRKSRIPYFVVQKNSILPDDKKNIILPIDTQKENKEKAGWVSYFARHLSTIADMVFYPSDEERQRNNIVFCSNFFHELNISYKKHELKKSPFNNINSEALKYAVNNDGLMLVIITTKNPDFLNKIFGFPETKIISNSSGIPVLCINPKKDLYIPCI